jgi:hypothetical protein
MTGKGLREHWSVSSNARGKQRHIRMGSQGMAQNVRAPTFSPTATRRRLAVAARRAYMYFVAFLDSERRRGNSRASNAASFVA